MFILGFQNVDGAEYFIQRFFNGDHKQLPA